MLFIEKGEGIPCAVGILTMEIQKVTAPDDKLASAARELEASLRGTFGEADRGALKALHPMDTYIAYYKRFGYTYHVLPQLESILKGREIPQGLPPVVAMFMAELKNQLLTAGHDLDTLRLPLHLETATGTESMLALGGKTTLALPGDLLIQDGEGVISSILRGPDFRTAITEGTKRLLYTVYAPSGVEEKLILSHLEDIEGYVRLAYPDAATLRKQVI